MEKLSNHAAQIQAGISSISSAMKDRKAYGEFRRAVKNTIEVMNDQEMFCLVSDMVCLSL